MNLRSFGILSPLVFLAGLCNAAEVRFVPASEVPPSDTSIKSFGYVRIDGPIAREDVSKLVEALLEAETGTRARTENGDPRIFVVIGSPGGEVLPAIDLGRLLRSAGASVWIDRNSECSSACVLVLAGGVVRYDMAGARVGLHRPAFPPEEFAGLTYAESQEHYNSLLNTVRDYLRGMGIGDAIYESMQTVPSQSIRYISVKEAEQGMLFGEDPAYMEWRRALAIENFGENRVQVFESFLECYNSRVGEEREESCFSILEPLQREEP